jgi:hypothetical protein
MVFDASGKKLFVVSVGCTEGDAGGVYTRRGIEEVDLAHPFPFLNLAEKHIISLIVAAGVEHTANDQE